MKFGILFAFFAPILANHLNKPPTILEQPKYVQMNTPSSNQLKIFHQDTAMISWNYAVPSRYVVKYDIYLSANDNPTQLLGKKLMTDNSFMDSSHNSPDIKLVEMTKNDIIISNVTSRMHNKSLLISLVMIDEDSNMIQKNETIVKFVVFRKPELSCVVDKTKSWNTTLVILCECISQPSHKLTYHVEPKPQSHKSNNVTTFKDGYYISKTRIVVQTSTNNNDPFVIIITANNIIEDEIYSAEKSVKLTAIDSHKSTTKFLIQPYLPILLSIVFLVSLALIVTVTAVIKLRSNNKFKKDKNEDFFVASHQDLHP